MHVRYVDDGASAQDSAVQTVLVRHETLLNVFLRYHHGHRKAVMDLSIFPAGVEA
jgi:hypothetical protein